MNLLIVFVLIVTIHALYNLINYLRFSYINNLLLGNYTDDSELVQRAKMHKNTILKYIKYAGIKDKYVPLVQDLGFNQISRGQASVFQNLLSTRQEIASFTMNFIIEAKGNYLSNFINSFNPFYWLRIILYLPKYTFEYLGVKSESVIIKIFQLLYWLIGTIFTTLSSIFPAETKEFILSIIHLF